MSGTLINIALLAKKVRYEMDTPVSSFNTRYVTRRESLFFTSSFTPSLDVDINAAKKLRGW